MTSSYLYVVLVQDDARVCKRINGGCGELSPMERHICDNNISLEEKQSNRVVDVVFLIMINTRIQVIIV